MEQEQNQAPLLPPDAEQSSAQPHQPYQAQPLQEKTDVYGIISIILAFTGFALIGLIIAIIGLKQAKLEQRSTVLSKVGLIINGILVGLVLLVIIFFVAIGLAL